MIGEESKLEPRRQSALTVEGAAWVAVLVLAAVLRLFQLGERPLSEAEATQALVAYRFIQGALSTAPAGTVPALFTGNLVGFTLAGASDAVARWLPLVAGLALAGLPYGLRHRLGRGGALVAAVLLAFSPTAVYFSRGLESATVVSACGLAVVVGLLRYLDTRRPAPLYLAAAALGLGLCAGAGFFTFILILAAFGLVLYLGRRALDRADGWTAIAGGWSALREDRELLTQTGLVLAGTFGLTATAFVLHPAGIGHAADLLGAWAQNLLPGLGSQPFLYPLLLLLRYEPLILVLGLVEAGWVLGWTRQDPRWYGWPGSAFPHTAFLAFWAMVALLIALLAGDRSPGGILLVVVPLALLAGQGAERAWRWVDERGLWASAGLFAVAALGLLAFFYLQVAFYSQASPTSALRIADLALYTTSTYLILSAVALLLVLALGAAVWIWRGPALVLAGGWLALVIALSLFGFQAMWRLSFAAEPRELMVAQATDPHVRMLVAELEALSRNRAGDAHTLPLTIEAETGPVVAWYLREFEDLRVVDGLSASRGYTPPLDTVAAVTLAPVAPDTEGPPIGEVFRGQSFPLRRHWLPWGLGGQDLVGWLLFSSGELPEIDREVVLWVANEL
jgi:uncharacterized protein (TIGR03663 family)